LGAALARLGRVSGALRCGRVGLTPAVCGAGLEGRVGLLAGAAGAGFAGLAGLGRRCRVPDVVGLVIGATVVQPGSPSHKFRTNKQSPR